MRSSKTAGIMEKNKLISIAGAFLLLWTFQTHAYDMPTGIPDPGFGIDDTVPARPAIWNSEVPGYYYINYVSGSDTNIYGTPSAPRKTLPNPIPAGSYVEMEGVNDYNAGAVHKINAQGTGDTWVAGVSGPVWVVGNTADPVNFTRKVIAYGSYLYFDNIKTSGAAHTIQIGSTADGYAASHIVLRNSEITGDVSNNGVGVSVVGSSLTPVNNVVLYNNHIHDMGDINATFDQDAHIITVGNYSSYVWVLDSTLHTSSGSGAQIGGAYNGEDNSHHVFFGRNHIYNTRQAGLAVKYASDVIFSENKLHDIVDTRPLYATSPSPSKGVGFQYAGVRLWIIANEIYNTSYGIYGGSTNGGLDVPVYAIGNLIYNTKHPVSEPFDADNAWSEAGIMMMGGTTRYLVNNTIFSSDNGINGPSTVGSYNMYNNIISELNEATGHHVNLENGAVSDASVIDGCVLHQTSGTPNIVWGSYGVTLTLAELQTQKSEGTNCVLGDPLFTDTLNNNFVPLGTSVAINAGTDAANMVEDIFSLYEQLYGASIRFDLLGNPRVMGKHVDAGAYEKVTIHPPFGIQFQ